MSLRYWIKISAVRRNTVPRGMQVMASQGLFVNLQLHSEVTKLACFLQESVHITVHYQVYIVIIISLCIAFRKYTEFSMV